MRCVFEETVLRLMCSPQGRSLSLLVQRQVTHNKLVGGFRHGPPPLVDEDDGDLELGLPPSPAQVWDVDVRLLSSIHIPRPRVTPKNLQHFIFVEKLTRLGWGIAAGASPCVRSASGGHIEGKCTWMKCLA